MAATAYAAVVSLLNTMDHIQNHPRLSTYFDNYLFESLRKRIDFFVDFVEKYSDGESEEAEDLVRRIAVAAHEAEDIIDVRAAANRTRIKKYGRMPLKMKMIMQEMDSIQEKAKAEDKTSNTTTMVEDEYYSCAEMMPPASSSSAPAAAKTTSMVGFKGYLKQLLDQLIGHPSSRKILPIVGMGGIGKTMLATNVYHHLLTVRHFDVCVWITVSQEFSARDIFLQALSCLKKSKDQVDRRSDDELGEELYKILYGRRYLVILDDVWSVEAWENIKFFFPENDNGSRIVVTTRESELVNYFGSCALAVDFLDDKNSWQLFCEKTFAQDGCPPELEGIGREIVYKCKGLPLAILLVGGLLRKSPKTREYWERIAKDKSSLLDSGEGNKHLSILYLSYKHLPVWLKSCFLYLGLFPEDYEIDVSQLFKLWVAEGFIKPKTNQSLEQVAESYLKNLVDRNLLLVGRLGPNRKLETCYLHDLVRELCIRIGEKENHCCVQRDINGSRHYIVDERTARLYTHTSETPSIIRPLIFEGKRVAPCKSRLLRVLFSVQGNNMALYRDHLDSTFREFNLRFLAQAPPTDTILGTYKLPASISLLWSLQTLILIGTPKVIAPPEIWEMSQLRHIQISSICLPDPPLSDKHVLQNLQTLETVHNLIFTEEVCKRLPNIKDLQLMYDFDEPGAASLCYHLHNLGCFNTLESLDIYCNRWRHRGGGLLQSLKLPSSLKKLALWKCQLGWSDMAMIGSLPHLQILSLFTQAIVGPEWKCVEKEFPRLKCLEISGCEDLVHWIAENSSFPVLETLRLFNLPKLEEIPSWIGEIPTLEKIHMKSCSESATISAVKILHEQENLGNQDLLYIILYGKTEEKKLRGKIEDSGFECQNLYIADMFLL